MTDHLIEPYLDLIESQQGLWYVKTNILDIPRGVDYTHVFEISLNAQPQILLAITTQIIRMTIS